MKYYSIINIGFYRADIGQKISLLLDKIHFSYSIYNRINELGKFNDAKHIKESKERFIAIYEEGIKEINEDISTYNKSIKEIDSNMKVKRIAITPVRTEIKRLFRKLEVDSKGYKLVAPFIEKDLYNFFLKTFDPVFDDLVAHKKATDDFIKSFKTKDYAKIYKDDLEQLLDIYIMGYKSTAVLVLGRIFEKLFTLWGLSLISQKKLTKTKEQFAEMRLENVLGLFKSQKLISEKDWLILSKLRLDRNIGGHYISEKDAIIRGESEKESESTIRLAVPLLKKYHRKIV